MADSKKRKDSDQNSKKLKEASKDKCIYLEWKNHLLAAQIESVYDEAKRGIKYNRRSRKILRDNAFEEETIVGVQIVNLNKTRWRIVDHVRDSTEGVPEMDRCEKGEVIWE